MNFLGCSMIQRHAMNFNGRIDTEDAKISLCCEGVPNIPHIPFAGTPEEILRNFTDECAALDAECANASNKENRNFTLGCSKCPNFQYGDWRGNGLINYINLSMYPSPCQCRCIYCTVHENDQSINETAKECYEKLFSVLELGERCGIIPPNAGYQVSCGEIAIHPYHERIMKLVKGKPTCFYTNCMKFDEDIANNLRENPYSSINLSIDAGTPKTWHKIKGYDNFDKVTENLVKYYSYAFDSEQITLKYIILPGINDFYEDYASLIEIMKVLNVNHLTIACDGREKYNMSKGYETKLIGATAYLLAMCYKNDISNDMFTFTPKLRDKSIKQANEILRKRIL